MNSKTHRQNHNFQIAYFLAGACHTPDGAYAMLCDLKEDRVMAIQGYEASLMKVEAKILRANKRLNDGDEADRLEAGAELMEIENGRKLGEVNYKAALDELRFIDECLVKIQPLRKFKDLPDPEAHEAAQRDEWRLELIRRAENNLITTGTINPDQFDTMRMHPDFKESIMPRIKELQLEARQGKDITENLTTGFSLPLLLETNTNGNN